MKMIYNIKWTNNELGDSGFVKKINPKKGFFENVFDQMKAKSFASEEEANEAIETIKTLANETNNNSYEVVSIEMH